MDQILIVACELAKAVIQTEVKTNPQVILNTLKEAIASLPMSDRKVTVYLHPDDLKIVQLAYSEDAIKEQSWHLIADPSLDLADIQVACVDSKIDYKLSDRISAALDRFLLQNATPEVGSDDASSVLLSDVKDLPHTEMHYAGEDLDQAEQKEMHPVSKANLSSSDKLITPIDVENDVDEAMDEDATETMTAKNASESNALSRSANPDVSESNETEGPKDG